MNLINYRPCHVTERAKHLNVNAAATQAPTK